MDYFEVIGLVFILLMFILANLPKRKKAPLAKNANRPKESPPRMIKNEGPKPLAPLKPPSPLKFDKNSIQRHIQTPIGQNQIISPRYQQTVQKKIRKKSSLHSLLKDKRKLILSHEILKRPYE